MNIEYLETAFAFNPIFIRCTNVYKECILEHFDNDKGVFDLKLVRIPKSNTVEFDVSSFAQSLFDKTRFHEIPEKDEILFKNVSFVVRGWNEQETGVETAYPSINVIWGGLDIGETYRRSKTLTWFKNLPFTFPLFLEHARSFVVETDDAKEVDWKIVTDGKHNMTPDVDAQRKAVFYVGDAEPIVFESEFVFDVKIGNANQTPERIVNLGAVTSGYAEFIWGDGTTDILPVPKSTIQKAQDPAGGGEMDIVIGSDFTHAYGQPGTYTATVRTTGRVDAFRFATLSPDANNEWYTTGEMNDHVTKIRKIRSKAVTNASRMFSGVRYGEFDDDFVLECPNAENFDYMFEFFGVRDYALYEPDGGDGRIDCSLLFPLNFWGNLAAKNKATKATRMFNGSGFLKIQRHMLGFSTVLTSVLETFRGMFLVGNNWAARSGAKVLFPPHSPVTEEFVETDLFHDNPNISKFNGCFWFINEQYGNFNHPDSNYAVRWALRADMFKYNTANDISLNWMFKQCGNRMVAEVNLFRHICTRIKSMDGIFWGSMNNGGNPQVAADGWMLPGWMVPHPDSPEWTASPHNRDYRGFCDLNWLFFDPANPTETYPALESAVCSFGWRYNENANGTLEGSQHRTGNVC